MICCQYEKVFSKVGFNEIFEWCQKKFFQSKNSHRSKQTTAKGKQIENLIDVFVYHLSNSNDSNLIREAQYPSLPTSVPTNIFFR